MLARMVDSIGYDKWRLSCLGAFLGAGYDGDKD